MLGLFLPYVSEPVKRWWKRAALCSRYSLFECVLFHFLQILVELFWVFWGGFFGLQVLVPKILGKDVPQNKLDSALEDLNGSLKILQEKFLQDRPFIAGDHMTLADLVAIVELMQVCRKAFFLLLLYI